MTDTPGNTTPSGTPIENPGESRNPYTGVIQKRRRPGLTQDFTVKRVASVKKIGASTNVKKKVFSKQKLESKNQFMEYLHNRRPARMQPAPKRVVTPWQNLDMTLTGGSSLNDSNIPSMQEHLSPRPSLGQMLPPIDAEESAFSKRLRKATSTPKQEPAKPVKQHPPQSRVYSRVVEVKPDSKPDIPSTTDLPTRITPGMVQRQPVQTPPDNRSEESKKPVREPFTPAATSQPHTAKEQHSAPPAIKQPEQIVQRQPAEEPRNKPSSPAETPQHQTNDLPPVVTPEKKQPYRAVQRIEAPEEPETSISKHSTPPLREAPKGQPAPQHSSEDAKPLLKPEKRQTPGAPAVSRETSQNIHDSLSPLPEQVNPSETRQPDSREPGKAQPHPTPHSEQVVQREPQLQGKQSLKTSEETTRPSAEPSNLEKPLLLQRTQQKDPGNRTEESTLPLQKPASPTKPVRQTVQRQESKPALQPEQPAQSAQTPPVLESSEPHTDHTKTRPFKKIITRSKFKPLSSQNKVQLRTKPQIPLNFVIQPRPFKEIPRQKPKTQPFFTADRVQTISSPLKSEPTQPLRTPTPQTLFTTRTSTAAHKSLRAAETTNILSSPEPSSPMKTRIAFKHFTFTPPAMIQRQMLPGVLQKQQAVFKNSQATDKLPTATSRRKPSVTVSTESISGLSPVTSVAQQKPGREKPTPPLQKMDFGVLQRKVKKQGFQPTVRQALDLLNLKKVPAAVYSTTKPDVMHSQPQRQQKPAASRVGSTPKKKSTPKSTQTSGSSLEQYLQQIGIGTTASPGSKTHAPSTPSDMKPEMPVLHTPSAGVSDGIVQRDFTEAALEKPAEEAKTSKPEIFEFLKKTEEPPEPPNLAHLAKQIFPIIRRMLALEKERSSGKTY